MRAVPILAGAVAVAAPAAPAFGQPQTLACGAVVTQSTTLAANVGPCPGNGLIIARDGITLDLNGYSVIGTFGHETPGNFPATNVVEGQGIDFQNTTNSTVRNGQVYHFSVGVRIDGGSHNAVTNMNVHDNTGLLLTDAANNGDGIALYGSNYNTITQNVVEHNGVWDGITTLSSDGNTGTDGSSYNTISDNLISQNNIPMYGKNGKPNWKRDIGVAIEGPGSTNNLVSNNVIERSGTHGVQMFPDCDNAYGGFNGQGCAGTVANDYNTIAGNTITGNGFGLPLAAPVGDGVSILAMGPSVDSFPGHETVTNNKVNGNERNGISLGGGNGQDLYGGTVSTAGENYGCLNDTGVPCGVNNNTIDQNSTQGNGEDGIYVGPNSDFNSVTSNTAVDNAMDGIGLGLAVLYSPQGVNCGDVNCTVVLDANGNPVTIPGTAAKNNTFSANTATGNGRWDAMDMNTSPPCDNNQWSNDIFGRVNQSCIG